MSDKEKTLRDLRDKMAQITKPDSSGETPVRFERGEIEAVVPGVNIPTPFGPCYVVQTRYDLGDFHGDDRIREVFLVDQQPVLAQAPDLPFDKIDPTDALYIDTETTGLSAAMGAFAFMIGFGFFENNAFHVWQTFSRDYQEEPAALWLFTEWVKKRTHMVSFNGKGFDVPMLYARMKINKFDLPLSLVPHLDLLPLSRRLWKYADHGCKLSALEENVLGFSRIGDIPSFQIPDLYSEYLRTRDAKKLAGVFEHNVHDVVSMVTLQTRIAKVLSQTMSREMTSAETFGLGRIFADQGKTDRALAFMSQSASKLPDKFKPTALRYLAGLHRKRKEYDLEAKYIEQLVQMNPESIRPYRKLVIHLEQRAKDYEKALAIMEQADVQVVFASYKEKQKWEKRKERVLMKLEKSRA